jgi:hypothetical protein
MNEYSRKYGIWAVVAAILALGLVLSAFIATGGMVKIKTAGNTVTVTGSAKKQIKSDLIVWDGSFTVQSPQLSAAYNQLKTNQAKVRTYMLNKGIAEQDMIFSSISTMINHVILPSGQYSNQVESYQLSQQVEIRSGDVEKITALSREATELINEGVEFQSNPPQYFYTKIADLKVEMLALATKDAVNRADQIATNARSKIGALCLAKMGVFQITPLYSRFRSE